MKLIVGLGNPGSEYENTRHNAGFKVIDLVSTVFGAELKFSKNLWSVVSKSNYKGNEVVLAKPLTYMNESGRAVTATIRWFKIKLSDVLVLHDDVSLPLGRIRLQKGGGAGGQHGVESIIDCLGGGMEFDRIKIGVGPDPGGDMRARFVLSAVQEKDRKLLNDSLDLAGQAVRSWIENGPGVTANKFNGINLGEPIKTAKKAKPEPRPETSAEQGTTDNPEQ
ncbi:MAG: aminoacyl-tRNA hydrolase [Cyanobacteria bacterium]|nr:aminoacyl-tRNA hydrolase [Cyanobacteriota bacterium]